MSARQDLLLCLKYQIYFWVITDAGLFQLNRFSLLQLTATQMFRQQLTFLLLYLCLIEIQALYHFS